MIVNKYQGNGGGGGSYTLPVASQSTLGGVKVGEGLSIDSGGTLSVSGGSSAGGDYVIVDSLSEITTPTEGMIAFVPEHQETYSGLSMDGGQLADQARVIKYAPREIEYTFSDSHNFDTNNPNSAPYDFDSDEQGNWHSIWDESVWLRYDSVQDRTYCVTKPGFSVICYLSSESYEEITTAVTISPKTYIYRNSNWLRYEDGLISFRLDTIATMAEWTAFIANAKAFAPGDFQFVVDYYMYGWNTYKFKTKEGYALDDFNGYTFVCKASNGESTDEASALSLKVSNGSGWKDYGIAKYDLRPTWSQIVTAGTQIASVTINGETTNVYAPEAAGGGGGDYVVVDSLSEITTPTEGMIAFVSSHQVIYSGYSITTSIPYTTFKINQNTPMQQQYMLYIQDDRLRLSLPNYVGGNEALKIAGDGVLRSIYMDSIFASYDSATTTTVILADSGYTFSIGVSQDYVEAITSAVTISERTYIYRFGKWFLYEDGKASCYLSHISQTDYSELFSYVPKFYPGSFQFIIDVLRGSNLDSLRFVGNNALNANKILAGNCFVSNMSNDIDRLEGYALKLESSSWSFARTDMLSGLQIPIFVDFEYDSSTSGWTSNMQNYKYDVYKKRDRIILMYARVKQSGYSQNTSTWNPINIWRNTKDDFYYNFCYGFTFVDASTNKTILVKFQFNDNTSTLLSMTQLD